MRLFPALEAFIMKISYLLMLPLVSAAVLGLPSRTVIAILQSSINLTTSFNPDDAKDFTWTFKTKQETYQIIKIQNGRLLENLNNRYNPSHQGNILGINNVTKNDSGHYTAVITMSDDSMMEEIFNLTVVDPVPTLKIENQVERIGVKSNPTARVVVVVVVVAVLVLGVAAAFLVWKFKLCTRSSNTSKRDDPEDGEKTRQNNNMVEEEENYKNKYEENKDDQDEGRADENGNEVREHQNQDEHQNEDNVKHPIPEIGGHKMWANSRHENEVKKCKKADEHRSKSENKEIQLQDTSGWDDRVRKYEVEEQEKDDKENDEGCPLLEETDATTALKIADQRIESNPTDMMSSVSQRLWKDT